MSNEGLKTKLIHLSADVVKKITIKAVNADTTFKEYVQDLIKKESEKK